MVCNGNCKVNCKVKFIRPQYKNLKEWVENENNVYIGRAGVVFIDFLTNSGRSAI